MIDAKEKTRRRSANADLLDSIEQTMDFIRPLGPMDKADYEEILDLVQKKARKIRRSIAKDERARGLTLLAAE